LLSQTLETRADLVAPYVLLREAQDLAAQSPDVELALRALAEMSQGYVVDELRSRVAIYEKAAKVTAAQAPLKLFADRIVEALPEAIAQDDDLPLHTAGSDWQLRELAREAMAPKAEALVQVRRGDGWWALAETQQGTARRQIRERAVYWYQQALPGLSGLTCTRVEQLIKLASGV